MDIQRARMLAAMGEAACERGAANVTVADVVERAGVSRRTFYEVFSDIEDCLLAAMQAGLERVQARVLAVWRSEGSWRERVRGVVSELLCVFDEEPVLAGLLVVEPLAAGRTALQRRAVVLEAVIDAVQEGRGEVRASTNPDRLAAEGAVGGALAVLYARLTSGEPRRLPELAGPLTSMIVLPYLGARAARRELERPMPAHVSREVSPSGTSVAELQSGIDPFKAAGMRMTYRTVRVLGAIADHPGCSNRQVGRFAEVGDPGQISKLLGRLHRLGLITNGGRQPSQGEPNAWSVTPAGRQLAETVRAHVEGLQ